MRASRSGCRNRGASAAECGLGRSAAEHGLANRRGTRFGVLPRMTLSQLPRPCFGFSMLTVQRSTEPLLRGKAPASPLTAVPAEMRQEVRPCVSFLAMSVTGRNRRVSTMGVYHRRPIRRVEGATRRSSEPPRFNEAKCRAHRTRRALASWRRRAAQSGRYPPAKQPEGASRRGAGSMTPPRPIRRARLVV